MVKKRVQSAVLGCSLKINIMISVQYQVKPFNIKEAEVEQLYEAL